jgi:methionine sulfoxide reductase heme-binding subunit
VSNAPARAERAARASTMPERTLRQRLRNPPRAAIRAIKVALFAAALLPLGRLVVGFWLDMRGGPRGFVTLGVNPIEFITRSTGTWTLVFLLLTLAVTPLRRMLDLPWLLRLRRMLGLFAFAYGCLHLATYLWLDQFFDAAAIAKDIAKRPFITMGFAAWTLLVPLAVTSTNGWVKRLGGARWRALHRLAYVAACCGVVHYWWLVKKDVTQPAIYAVVLAALLGFRVVARARDKASAARRR